MPSMSAGTRESLTGRPRFGRVHPDALPRDMTTGSTPDTGERRFGVSCSSPRPLGSRPAIHANRLEAGNASPGISGNDRASDRASSEQAAPSAPIHPLSADTPRSGGVAPPRSR
jgi:hypothetical protein